MTSLSISSEASGFPHCGLSPPLLHVVHMGFAVGVHGAAGGFRTLLGVGCYETVT
jgi:hypothetical protein